MRAHGRGHVHYVPARTAEASSRRRIDTGHMWVEGLLLLGALTGRRRYVDAARCDRGLPAAPRSSSAGRGRSRARGTAAGRSSLSARSTARPPTRAYLDGARRVARQALAAQGEDGRWTMRVGFRDGYCAWQNAVLLIGLARLLAVDPEPRRARARRSARAARRCSSSAATTTAASSISTGSTTAGSRARAHLREALAAAHALTDDERYLTAGLEGGAAAWLRPRGQGPGAQQRHRGVARPPPVPGRARPRRPAARPGADELPGVTCPRAPG